MDNINLPNDVIQHIKGLIPRDSDMSHPTAALLKNPIAWWDYGQRRFPNILNTYLYGPPVSFARFVRGSAPRQFDFNPDELSETSDEDNYINDNFSETSDD